MAQKESTSWIVLAWLGSVRSCWLPRWLGLWTCLALLSFTCPAITPAHAGALDVHGPRTLAFEENRGQVDDQVKFVARGPGYTAFFTSTDAVLALPDGPRSGAVVRLKPVEASATAQIVGAATLPTVVHYARHTPGSKTITVPTYERVRYVGLYPGIDLEYYARAGRLEYDFVLAPGADPDTIALAVEGAARVEIDARGDLVMHTGAGELRQAPPVVYQEIDGARRAVTGAYRLDGDGRVRIRLGAYDAAHRLVIDPVLAYSTYLGGSSDESHSLYPYLFGIAHDANGNTYVTGTTTSVDFPTTPGAYRTLGGSQDAFVTKFSPTGAVVYSTYLGGPCRDTGNAIAVDAAGNAYVAGRAHELCFFGEAQSGALVAKLDPTGAVVYALVFGGALVDTSQARGIAVDAAGHAYVTGDTSSTDFPTTAGSYRPQACVDGFVTGASNGFVAKLAVDGSSLLASTFLCGNGTDTPNALALDAAGNVYVAGVTTAGDFPRVNALQTTHLSYPNGTTGFVSKLSGDLSQLLYSTYLGGSINDTIRGLAVDGQGNAYVTGETTSTDFPTTAGVIQPERNNIFCLAQFCSEAFVAKINPTGNALVYSTYLYGEGDDAGRAIAVDGGGNAYVVGMTGSLYFPIADAFQPTSRVSGPADAFITKLNADATRIVYSSYFGGSGPGGGTQTGFDLAAAIALDAAGNAYVAGYTQSLDLPTTPGAFQTANGGGVCDYFGSPCGDAFFVKITAGGPGPTPTMRVDATPIDTVPGGIVNTTWAGIPIPGAGDQLALYPLGGKFESAIWVWSTGGAAAGTLAIALPTTLPFGTYELRVLSMDPQAGDREAMARSKPIHVGLAAVDLVVANIATTPAQPLSGQAVTVTVTVTNQGNLDAGGFVVDFYKDRAAAPGAGVAGDVRCPIAGLAAGASTQCTGTVTYAAAGTFSEWAQVDTAQAVAESNETNNVAGPRTVTVSAPAGADLVVVAVGTPPASATPGKSFSISDTVKNTGGAAAAASATRYYLSLDLAKGAGDTLMTGTRTVAALAAGAQSAGIATITIPLATPPATYHLLACADDLQAVTETSEVNNCLAAATTIAVGYPDLVETAVTNPPAAARPGTTFSVTDTVRNQGVAAAGASTTRYYLSADTQKGTGDRLLTGTHAAVSLAPGAVSTKTVTLTIPTTTPVGTYRLLACADDLDAVVESDEQNNCLASATTITIALPDLVQQTVLNPAGPVRRGTAFTVTDTVRNQSVVATARSATTRYYLSLDGAKSTGDTRLTGTRTVPILAATATSTGSVSVTIPTTAVPGTYHVLACADDGKAVAESNEANNCAGSATLITVTP